MFCVFCWDFWRAFFEIHIIYVANLKMINTYLCLQKDPYWPIPIPTRNSLS